MCKVGDAYQLGGYLPGKPAEQQPTIVYIAEVMNEEGTEGLVYVVQPDGTTDFIEASTLQADWYRGNIRQSDLEKMLQAK